MATRFGFQLAAVQLIIEAGHDCQPFGVAFVLGQQPFHVVQRLVAAPSQVAPGGQPGGGGAEGAGRGRPHVEPAS